MFEFFYLEVRAKVMESLNSTKSKKTDTFFANTIKIFRHENFYSLPIIQKTMLTCKIEN